MANRYWVGGTGTWNASSTTNWSATSGGASGASVPTAADVAIFDQAATYTVTIGGTGSRTALAITNTAGTVTFTGTTALAIGGLTLTATAVWSNTGALNFSVAGTHTIDTKNVLVGVSTFSASASSWTLASDFRATGTTRLLGGTLDLNGFTLTSDQFYADTGSAARTLAFGSTGQITVTGLVTTTIIDFVNTTYPAALTMTGSKRINISTSRTAVALAYLGPYEVDVYVTQGTYIIGFYGSSKIRNLDLTGFAGSLGGLADFTGNVLAAVGMTPGNLMTAYFVGTGTQTITSNGNVLFDFLTVNSSSTVQLQDDLTVGGGGNLEMYNGVLDLNGFVLEVNTAYLIGYNDLGDPTTPELQMSSGTIRVENGLLFDVLESPAALPTVTGSGTVEIFGNTVFSNVAIGWMAANPPGPADIRVAAFPTVQHTGTASLVVYGTNTFTALESGSLVGAVVFVAGTTNTFDTFNISGGPGALKTLTAGSDGYTAATQATLLKSTTWFVGANSVDDGNNTGLIFTAGGINDYLAISNIIGGGSGTTYATDVIEGVDLSDAAVAAEIKPASVQEAVEAQDATAVVVSDLVWSEFDDSQTPNWQNVDNTQVPTWTPVDDSQTPGWTPVTP